MAHWQEYNSTMCTRKQKRSHVYYTERNVWSSLRIKQSVSKQWRTKYIHVAKTTTRIQTSLLWLDLIHRAYSENSAIDWILWATRTFIVIDKHWNSSPSKLNVVCWCECQWHFVYWNDAKLHAIEQNKWEKSTHTHTHTKAYTRTLACAKQIDNTKLRIDGGASTNVTFNCLSVSVKRFCFVCFVGVDWMWTAYADS